MMKKHTSRPGPGPDRSVASYNIMLLSAVFLSGISGLVYEVAWARKLGLILGS